ncbi:hypothetical protein WJX74_002075 [Apatococcus lobatus]|uniref:Uncharacterized protein n=1 Tax=Apatococcus lobatus TaxID=904363 RepID=A0AAW1RMD0_9CHLO
MDVVAIWSAALEPVVRQARSCRATTCAIPGELSGPVQCMASDGALLWFGLGGANGSILGLQATDAGLARRQELAGHSGGVSCLLPCQHQGQPVMLSAGSDFQVKIWSADGKLLRMSGHHHASVEALSAVPGATGTDLVWSGSSDGFLFSMPVSSDADALQPRRIKASASAGITCITAVGGLMWVARMNGSIAVFDPRSETMSSEVIGRSARISCMGVAGQHVWVGYSDRHITVHDARTAELLYNVGDQGGFLKNLLVSGWNIWTINSTGIKVFADEGQHLQAQHTMQEQQEHLSQAATLAAALRSKVSELQDQVQKLESELQKSQHRNAADKRAADENMQKQTKEAAASLAEQQKAAGEKLAEQQAAAEQKLAAAISKLQQDEIELTSKLEAAEKGLAGAKSQAANAHAVAAAAADLHNAALEDSQRLHQAALAAEQDKAAALEAALQQAVALQGKTAAAADALSVANSQLEARTKEAEVELQQLKEQLTASQTLDAVSRLQTAAGLQQEADLEAALAAAKDREEDLGSLQQHLHERLTQAVAEKEAAQRDAFIAHEQLAELQEAGLLKATADQQRLKDDHAEQIRRLQAEAALLKQQQQDGAEQTSRIQLLQDEIGALRQQLLDQQQQAEADALENASALQSHEADIADLQQQLAARAADKSQFESNMAATDDLIASLKAEHAQAVATAEGKADSMQQALQEADKLIATLKAQQVVSNGSQSQPLTPPPTPPARTTHPGGHHGQAAGRASAIAHASANINIGSQPPQHGYPGNVRSQMHQQPKFQGFQQVQADDVQHPNSAQEQPGPEPLSSLPHAHVEQAQDVSFPQVWANLQPARLQHDSVREQPPLAQHNSSMNPSQSMLLDDASRPSTSGMDPDDALQEILMTDEGPVPSQSSPEDEAGTMDHGEDDQAASSNIVDAEAQSSLRMTFDRQLGLEGQCLWGPEASVLKAPEGDAGMDVDEDAHASDVHKWAATMEADLDSLAAVAAATRVAAGAQIQELRAAALELGQQQMGGLQDLQKLLSDCLQDRYELQVASRALQKQALQEAGQNSKVLQLELGVQQAALDHQRLEQELAGLLQELSLEPVTAAHSEPSKGAQTTRDQCIQTDEPKASVESPLQTGLTESHPCQQHPHKPGWRHEYQVVHGRIVDSPTDSSETGNDGHLSNPSEPSRCNQHQHGRLNQTALPLQSTGSADLLVTQSLPAFQPKPSGVPMQSSAKRPCSLKSLQLSSHTQDHSSGLISAHRSCDADSLQQDGHGLQDALCEPFLPALYSLREPVRYLAPTGYI